MQKNEREWRRSQTRDRVDAVHSTAYNIQHTTYNRQHTTYNIQHTTHNIQHVACRANRDVEDACLLTPIQESAQLIGG